MLPDVQSRLFLFGANANDDSATSTRPGLRLSDARRASIDAKRRAKELRAAEEFGLLPAAGVGAGAEGVDSSSAGGARQSEQSRSGTVEVGLRGAPGGDRSVAGCGTGARVATGRCSCGGKSVCAGDGEMGRKSRGGRERGSIVKSWWRRLGVLDAAGIGFGAVC